MLNTEEQILMGGSGWPYYLFITRTCYVFALLTSYKSFPAVHMAPKQVPAALRERQCSQALLWLVSKIIWERGTHHWYRHIWTICSSHVAESRCVNHCCLLTRSSICLSIHHEPLVSTRSPVTGVNLAPWFSTYCHHVFCSPHKSSGTIFNQFVKAYGSQLVNKLVKSP